MPPEVLSLDEQFFYRIALKNGLITAEDATECIRVRHALARRGKKKPLQEIMLDTGLLTPEEVDKIHEAQEASQVLRLDSLYADIALKLGIAPREELDRAFKIQREKLFKVRIGELLVDRGAISSAQHRQVLMALLAQVRSEEKEYIRDLRLKKRFSSTPRPAPTEEERLRLALTEAGQTVADEPAEAATAAAAAGASAPAGTAGASAPAAAGEASAPAAAAAAAPGNGAPAARKGAPALPPALRIDSEDLESLDVNRLHGASGDDVAPGPASLGDRPAPAAAPALGESLQGWLGASSTDGRAGPRPKAPSSEDELPESFFASNVIAVREEARKSPPPPAAASGEARAAVASKSGRLPPGGGRAGGAAPPPRAKGGTKGRGREPRKAPQPELAHLLESAIEMIDEAPPSGGAGRDIQESDLLAVEGDLADANALVKSGLPTFRQLARRSSDGARAPAFSTDAYLRRRRRRATLARLGAAAVLVFVVAPFGVGTFVAHRNRSAVGAAREAMARGDFDAAASHAEAAGEFWVGAEPLATLREEIELRRALVPVEAAEAAGEFGRAAVELRAIRDRFPRFVAELGERERRLAHGAHFARGEAAERAAELAAAVAAFEEARRALPEDGGAARRIAAIRRQLEEELDASALPDEGGGGAGAAVDEAALERRLEAVRRFHSVFGGREEEVDRLVLALAYRRNLAQGDAAAARRPPDYEAALGHYYKASEAAAKLGRPREIAELEARTRAAHKRASFQRFFNDGQALEMKGRFAEAVQAYRRAASWLEPAAAAPPSAAGGPALPPPVVLSGIGRKGAGAPAAPPPAPASEDASVAAEPERDRALLSLLEARIEACERERARRESEAQATRLWKEAIEALRSSRVDQAVAALDALARERPKDERVLKTLAFARSLGDAVYVPAGAAVIGSAAGAAEKDEGPPHRVETPAFFIDRTEVRNRDYAAFLEATGGAPPEHWTVVKDGPRGRTRTYAPEHADHPVVNVSWFEAEKYADWAEKRLPAEEEWEKAARGGDERTFPWGETTEGKRANVGAKVSERVAIGTKPVGTSPDDVSPCGCVDMGGNVSEWTASRYRPYAGNTAKGIEWSDEQKVLRGGSWRYEWPYARCSNRDRSRPEKRYTEVGFRCVRDVPDWLPELK